MCVLVAVSAVAVESGFPNGVRNSPEDRMEGMIPYPPSHQPANFEGIPPDDNAAVN